jgi:restriction endonuclease S subunit
MPPNTVLIALTGATCGLSALSKIEACANQSVTGILPSKNHVPEYLFHYLRTQRQRILDKAWGNAQPHISQAFVKDFRVPLPSLPDQLHIANLLSKAENLIAQRKESIRLLDEFLKSTFLEMFGDPVITIAETLKQVFSQKLKSSLPSHRTPNPICPNRRKNRSPQNPIPTKLAGVGEFVWQFKSKGV